MFTNKNMYFYPNHTVASRNEPTGQSRKAVPIFLGLSRSGYPWVILGDATGRHDYGIMSMARFSIYTLRNQNSISNCELYIR